MARIIRDRAVVEDAWQRLGDEDALVDGPVIVSWSRWQRDRDALAAHEGGLGVELTGDVDVAEVALDQAHFDLIALSFPAFKDGRGYSQARLLRERHGYTGELRAVGDVLQDQLFYLRRVGFDSFALRADRDAEAALAAFDTFSMAYQPGRDGTPVAPRWHRGASATR